MFRLDELQTNCMIELIKIHVHQNLYIYRNTHIYTRNEGDAVWLIPARRRRNLSEPFGTLRNP